MKAILLALASSIVVSGCATGPYEWRYGQDKIVPGQFSMTNTERNGTVLTWPSHAVAAIVYPDGRASCVQSAQSAKARNMSGGGSLLGSLPTGESVEARIAQAITEAAASLQDRNDVATFLDVALFQVCALSANQRMTPEQTIGLVEAALDASAAIAKARPNYTTPTHVQVTPGGATISYPGAFATPSDAKDDLEDEGSEGEEGGGAENDAAD